METKIKTRYERQSESLLRITETFVKDMNRDEFMLADELKEIITDEQKQFILTDLQTKISALSLELEELERAFKK